MTRFAPLVTRREALQQMGITAFGLGMAACAPAARPASPAPAPADAPVLTPSAVTREVAKVTIAIPTKNLSFAPVFLADGMKYFEDEAIDANLQLMQGNALTIAALLSGDVHFNVWGASDAFAAYEKQLDLLTVVGFSRHFSSSVAVRGELLQQKGVTPQSPPRDKLEALRGATFGVNSLASIQVYALKYLLGQAGMDPEADVQFRTIGAGGPMNAALRQGHIDGIVAAIPFPELLEKEGLAVVYIRLAEEVPIFRDWAGGSMAGRKPWIESNADVTERVCRALGRACNLLLRDLPRSKEVLKGVFNETDPEIVDFGLETLKDSFSVDAKVTQERWAHAAEVFVTSGQVQAPPPLADGTFWTNKYIVNVPGA